ncbi:GDSL-type esterase/lipase family protein [Antarcticirhabdus aurantiaca]|uniref:GDSL-type esterase/lipase family protein n=1 Tax=Antarcticirhabdus aurantiaca TaxID=2606717 RepID=A0ACD4NNR2_9HYPH|nr:GDSL-type esterase/lipase family protein [Antarcticirhabdus aurantiaca]WAJ28458.1 GDSL-type esterase/lipase family protein [Jeongeuplla avenae]
MNDVAPHAQPIPVAELERMLLDPTVSDAEIRPYLMSDDTRSSTFVPSVRVNPSMVVGPGPSEGVRPQSALVLNSLNAIDRWRRHQRYRRKIAGWTGPRIVSEGDSWFQYPFLLDDVVDHLQDAFAVFSLDGAGDTLVDYLKQDELVGAVLAERPDAVLLSGGGNDLLGAGRLKHVVEPHRPRHAAQDHLREAFDRRLSEVLDDYRRLLSRLRAAAPSTPVFIHAYDHAIPRNGRWLGRPLNDIGVADPTLQREIVRLIVDRFHDGLARLIRDPAIGPRVTLVDCRGAVADGDWYDELHPDDEGFGVVAGRFRTALGAAPQPAGGLANPSASPRSFHVPQADANPEDAIGPQAVELARRHSDAVLYRELGRLMMLATSPAAPPANRLSALQVLLPASSVDGSSDSSYLLGRRVLARLHRELHALSCGSAEADRSDRTRLREAFGLGSGALAGCLAGILAGSAFALPAAAATVAAALLTKRFLAATLDETCEVWSEQLATEGAGMPAGIARGAAAIAAATAGASSNSPRRGMTTMSGNEHRFCRCLTRDDLSAAGRRVAEGQKAAVLDEAKWSSGALLRVRFLEGSQPLRQRVRLVAEEWVASGMANLRFEWIDDGDAEIRIAFRQGEGSWSYLGTVSRQITDQAEPTMNYGWLTDASGDEEVRSVVLHEFGHALGLIHEHQNPKGGIVWNEPAVVADLSGPPNNWTMDQIRFNVLDHYDPKRVTGSEIDEDSIMMYPIPESWTVGDFSTGFNGELSPTDREIIRQAYP